ncbi:MAG TPA: FAD:protein FMN transferase [Acidimicrobiales bacterium]|jgi:thiamine biosynthesis lipoprotein|nr:FAD:protein FMN transferase [Acidimicrobiales bacterium]
MLRSMGELRFRAMGSEVQVVVVGDSSRLAEHARGRIDELERRWSRFLPDSEISELTRRAGSPVEVSDDTIALVTSAIDAWRFTGATFDPTVLGAMLRAGYDDSFELVAAKPHCGESELVIVACTDIEIDGNAVTLPRGTGFDPGGIGKGLAADLVADELRAAGAEGVCINMGGDIRASGRSPEGDGWTIAVEHPWSSHPIADLGIGEGAIATSSTLGRRWSIDGRTHHHLIDPRTGEPADTDLTLVTVVAGSAWTAEVLAKAVLIRGSAHPFDLIEGSGAQALVVDDRGAIDMTDGFRDFAGAVYGLRMGEGEPGGIQVVDAAT